MGTGLATDALLALIDAPDPGLDGTEIQRRIATLRRRPRSDELLAALLRLESSDHVEVRRGEHLRFALTNQGRARAYELGGGRPVHVRLLMADLVGYVSFTATHGDEAAHQAAGALASAASWVVRANGGEVVKGLGDGFLAWLPPTADPLPVVAAVADGCTGRDGTRWQLRAASHVGRPIRQGGDLFGGDVNLVARLCQEAQPDQLVLTHTDDADSASEHLRLRGMASTVPVKRVPIR